MHKVLLRCSVSQEERQGLCTAVRAALEDLTPEGFRLVSGQQHHSHPVKSCSHTHTERVCVAARRARGAVGGGGGASEKMQGGGERRERPAFRGLTRAESRPESPSARGTSLPPVLIGRKYNYGSNEIFRAKTLSCEKVPQQMLNK